MKPHKYLAKRCLYRGRNYPSTAQAERAMALDAQRDDGEVTWFLEEVSFPLGEDTTYRVDFLVAKRDRWSDGTVHVHAEDVKGMETAAFKRIRKLWVKYGPVPLHILKGGKVEVITGGKE